MRGLSTNEGSSRLNCYCARSYWLGSECVARRARRKCDLGAARGFSAAEHCDPFMCGRNEHDDHGKQEERSNRGIDAVVSDHARSIRHRLRTRRKRTTRERISEQAHMRKESKL